MPTTEEITKALMEPFPKEALKSRQAQGGGGKSRLTYVDGTTVFRRLIAATGNSFTVEVLNQEFREFGKTSSGNDRLLLIASVRLTIPGMGSREHVGVQVVNADSGGEDLWKGAVTDAIKKAATLFGVGLELYGPDYEAEAVPAAPPATKVLTDDEFKTMIERGAKNPDNWKVFIEHAGANQDRWDWMIAAAPSEAYAGKLNQMRPARAA